MVKKVLVHEGVVAFRVVTRKVNVLVHIESDHILKANLRGLVHLDQRLVGGNWGGARRQA